MTGDSGRLGDTDFGMPSTAVQRSLSPMQLRLIAILSAGLLLVGSFVGLSTVPAQAATQGGACNGFSGAYTLQYSYSDSTLTVPACGPQPGNSGPNVRPYPGGLVTAGYQCVEFSERYLYYKYDMTMPSSTNGAQIVDHYAARYPGRFTVVNNGTPGTAPVQGDVLSYSGSINYNDFGHTSVVESSSVNASGNGTVTVIEENGAPSGREILNISGWRITNGGFSYIKWLHSTSVSQPSYEGAFQANTGSLILYGTAAKINTGLGMKAGTSPALAVNPSGQYQIAFQANTGSLWTYSYPGGGANVGQGMRAGTSPAIAALANGKFETAFQANTGSLVLFGNAAKVNTGLGMMAGTSPAMAVNSAGQIQVAFEANTGVLWTYSYPGGAANVGLAMKKGTSPSIAALPNGKFEVSYQTSSGALEVYGNAAKVNTGDAVVSTSSPAIAVNSAGQIQAGFAGTGNNLWTYSYPGGTAHPAQSIRSGTNPSISPLPNGKFEYALQSSAGQLWFVGNAATSNTGQGMMAGTSPSIVAR